MLDFLGIGSRKAATTWLFKRLAMHPETYFPFGKEAHYWNSGRFGGLYMQVFGKADFARSNGWKSGEITPGYAVLPPETIDKIKATFPEARVFMTARQPVGRIMSSVQMFCRQNGIDASAFGVDELRRICLDNAIILDRGRYATILPKWTERFPVKIILCDDIAETPLAALTDLCRYIGIDDTFFGLIPDRVLRQRVHVEEPLPAPPAFRAWVIEQSEDDIRAVEDATGRSLSSWRQ